DLVMITLHTRLHHEADDPQPGSLEPGTGKRRAMRVQSDIDRRRCRDRQGFQILRRAPGFGNLRANDVDRRLTADLTPDFLRDLAETRGAHRHDLILQRSRITRAGHRAIEVDLAKARRYVS